MLARSHRIAEISTFMRSEASPSVKLITISFCTTRAAHIELEQRDYRKQARMRPSIAAACTAPTRTGGSEYQARSNDRG